MKNGAFLYMTLAAVLGVAACGADDTTPREELAIASQEDRGYRTDQPAGVVAVPDTGGITLTGNLAEMNNSGTSGTVTLRGVHGQTELLLSLRGAQPGTSVRPTIHRGLCDEVGEPVRQLEPVEMEQTGIGTATITVETPVQQVADGRHSVRIYPEQGFQSPPLACAAIPSPAGESRM
ncbi:hypothetical protein BH23GEM3_BH23GEM3_05510 [soil metagenome]|jgi:hypothetical protein|nr:hypothetical protein [Gemmatimonadota bacterium]